MVRRSNSSSSPPSFPLGQTWTRNTEKLFQAIWEVAHLTKARGIKPFHVLTLPRKGCAVLADRTILLAHCSSPVACADPSGAPKKLETYQVTDDENDQTVGRKIVAKAKYLRPLLEEYGSMEDMESTVATGRDSPPPRKPSKGTTTSPGSKQFPLADLKPLPAHFFANNDPLLLNLGGISKKEGWVNVNSQVCHRSPGIARADAPTQPSSFQTAAENVEVIRQLHDLQV